MKALIHDPYLDTLGGGERYCLTIAEYLLSRGWQVDLFWDEQKTINQVAERFALKVARANLLGKRANAFSFWEKIWLTRGYDLVFWLSDGSLPFLFGKKNILHFQVPFVGVSRKPLLNLNRVKLGLLQKVVCNSKFTKGFIDREFKIKSLVLYPPVDIDQFKPLKKENIILAVGRFEESMQAKRQDVLIRAFNQMVGSGLSGWRLVLIGGSVEEASKNKLLKKLRSLASGYPIDFLVNSSFQKLRTLYGQARIFWHAAGFGIEESREPWRVEHFGITPVEAMASGCVPLVVNKGGLKEIVRRGAGERWGTVEELKEKTFNLIRNQSLYRQYQKSSLLDSRRFSKQNFCFRFESLLKDD